MEKARKIWSFFPPKIVHIWCSHIFARKVQKWVESSSSLSEKPSPWKWEKNYVMEENITEATFYGCMQNCQRAHFFTWISGIHSSWLFGDFKFWNLRVVLKLVIFEFAVLFMLEFLLENFKHPQFCIRRITTWTYLNSCIIQKSISRNYNTGPPFGFQCFLTFRRNYNIRSEDMRFLFCYNELLCNWGPN